MSSQPFYSPRLLFGPFEYDAGTGELRKHRTRIRLQGQPQQILAVLLESPGDPVSREELRLRLWPGMVSGDFEHGLNAAMNKLRQALGDSADQPRYIETLPGRGYRWIAPVHVPPAQTPGPVLEMQRPAPATRPSGNERASSGRWFLWAVVAIGALIAGAAAYWRLPPERKVQNAGRPSARFAVTPPPGFFLEGAGNRQAFAISPDGGKLAFTAMDASGLFRVFVRDLDALSASPVADSSGTSSVFWHPDSESLMFVAAGKLRRVMVATGATQVVADAIPGLLSGTWMGPDLLLVSSRLRSATIASSGGTLQHQEKIFAWPQLLPDGKHVLHAVFDPQIGRHRGRVARWQEDGEGVDLVESDSKVVYAHPGYLLYVRAGTLLAQPFDAAALRTHGEPIPIARGVCSFLPSASADFSVSDSGVLVYQTCVPRSQLVWVDRTGKRLSEASPAGVALKAARLSPDGQRLGTSIFDVDRGVTDVWLFHVDGSGGRRIPGAGLSHSPVWSPDGKQIMIARAFETSPKLYLRSLEGDEPEEALPRADFQMPTDWSRDGRFVVYTNTGLPLTLNERHGDVWAVDLQNNRRLIPLIRTPHHEANAAFSPDGQWVAFTSNESGRTEVYIQALERGESLRVVGERHLVSREGAQCLRWRSDGRELFYLGSNGRVHGVPLRFGRQTVSAGEPVPLFTISTEARAAVHAVVGFDVSADGSRFVIPVVDSSENPSLVVVQQWFHRLGRSRPE